MSEKHEPKFKIGDVVMNAHSGRIGEITDIKQIDNTFAYEVDNSTSLFLEDSLLLFTDHSEVLVDFEQVNVEVKYFIGDIVQVEGYGSELYKIVGVRIEMWRYKDDAWEEVIYELASIGDEEWLEADEEELSLIVNHEEADMFLEKVAMLYHYTAETKKSSNNKYQFDLLELAETRKATIDELLDIFNDYKLLYEWFKDEEYLEVMNTVLSHLKNLTTEQKGGLK
jgi:hypothetical protein